MVSLLLERGLVSQFYAKNLLLDPWCTKHGGLSFLCTLLCSAYWLNNWAPIGHCNISIWSKWRALHVLVIVHLASVDGAYRFFLKATLGNESHAACQSRLAASLMLLSNTCWSGKYESPIVWFSSYSVIKGWHLVQWLARVLMHSFLEACFISMVSVSSTKATTPWRFCF